MPNWLRWLLVVPGGLAGALLILFPMHWMVMVTFGGWNPEPTVVIGDRNQLKQIEIFLQGFLVPFAFVYCGAWIAPSNQIITSRVLAILGGSLGLIAVIAIMAFRPSEQLNNPAIPIITNMIGAALGAVLTQKRMKDEIPSTV